MAKKKIPKIKAASVAGVIATARKHFGIELTDEQATELLTGDPELLAEVGSDGVIDTAGRECLAMTMIDKILLGPPTVKDSLVLHGADQDYWHWPCNGSDKKYAKKFYFEFAKAAKAKGYEFA